MNLNEWFEKGLEVEEYAAPLDTHKEGFYHIYHHFTPPEDNSFFQSLKDKKWRALVLAEVWCGHCMLNIPVFLRIAEKADMPVRFLRRDENLALMDQYLTNGKRTIPIFIFIDENGNEVAKWGPMAEKTREFVTPLREQLPPKDADNYEEKFKEMVEHVAKAFRENSEFWDGVYESMKTTLEKSM